MKNSIYFIKLLVFAVIAIIITKCKSPAPTPPTNSESLIVDISDMKSLADLSTADTSSTIIIKESPLFKKEKCKRRFPINKFNFTIKGEGIDIPVKGGVALKIGKVELSTKIGSAITETVLIFDGYNEQLCQTRNIVGQVALACGQNREFYKIISLQTTANNALLAFFLALKVVQTEEDVKKELETLKTKITEIDKKLSEI